MDGWVSLEVSPTLADDTSATIAAARELHARANRPNLFIKVPGTSAGLPAIGERMAWQGPPLCGPGKSGLQRTGGRAPHHRARRGAR